MKNENEIKEKIKFHIKEINSQLLEIKLSAEKLLYESNLPDKSDLKEVTIKTDKIIKLFSGVKNCISRLNL